MNQPPEQLREQSMGDLFKKLSDDLTVLMRQEMELAKVELTEKGKQAGLGAGLLGGGGISALLALGSLTAFLIALLDTAMDTWLAALIVTVLWAATAGVLALQGKKRVQQVGPPVPEQTIETVKEDVEWAKTQRPSAQK